MRKVAKKMRDVAEKMQDKLVVKRREDDALGDFDFPYTPGTGSGSLLGIDLLTTRCPYTGDMISEEMKTGSVDLMRGSRVQMKGPNGIGKTTFLELLAKNEAEGVYLNKGAKIGYYRQDFNNFDFESTALECLEKASGGSASNQEIRATAGAFLLKNNIVKQQVKTLSEGQKALLSLACLVLEAPSILIMDEPTNHVNFRHLPAVARAVSNFRGAVLLVSHDPHFVKDVGVDKVVDMGFELGRGITQDVAA